MKWTIERTAITYQTFILFSMWFFSPNILIEKLTRCPADDVDTAFSMSSAFNSEKKAELITGSINVGTFSNVEKDCNRGLVHFIDRTLSKLDVFGHLHSKRNTQKEGSAAL